MSVCKTDAFPFGEGSEFGTHGQIRTGTVEILSLTPLTGWATWANSGSSGEIRTPNTQILNLMSLPIGLRSRKTI